MFETSMSKSEMNAWQIERFGGPEVFVRRRVPVLEVGPGDVLIRVAATSVNPVDTKIRSGVAKMFAPDFPATLHGDVAGTVVAVGKDVTHLRAGDDVYACAGGFKNLPSGALCDLMLADAALVSPKPKALSFAEAAALPLVAITAWEALCDKGQVQAGDRVLIHGATGGVGHVAVQLARALGATVYATASSPEKMRLGLSLGAAEVVGYHDEAVQDYTARLTGGDGFDLVFDTVGGENLERSAEAAALNGQIVTIAARESHDIAKLYAKGLTLHTVLMLLPLIYGVGRARQGKILEEITRLVESAQLKPLLAERHFTFEQIGDAHAYAESGDYTGKVVVTHPEAS